MPERRRGAVAKPGNAADAAPPAAPDGPRVLKKYPNRRLYDTRSSSYITLADVKDMVLKVEDFEVRDAKTGEDLTRSILLQIILDEESGGVPMFSAQMLAQIIRFYGHSMQAMMGTLLEKKPADLRRSAEALHAAGAGRRQNGQLRVVGPADGRAGRCDAGPDERVPRAIEDRCSRRCRNRWRGRPRRCSPNSRRRSAEGGGAPSLRGDAGQLRR